MDLGRRSYGCHDLCTQLKVWPECSRSIRFINHPWPSQHVNNCNSFDLVYTHPELLPPPSRNAYQATLWWPLWYIKFPYEVHLATFKVFFKDVFPPSVIVFYLFTSRSSTSSLHDEHKKTSFLSSEEKEEEEREKKNWVKILCMRSIWEGRISMKC